MVTLNQCLEHFDAEEWRESQANWERYESWLLEMAELAKQTPIGARLTIEWALSESFEEAHTLREQVAVILNAVDGAAIEITDRDIEKLARLLDPQPDAEELHRAVDANDIQRVKELCARITKREWQAITNLYNNGHTGPNRRSRESAEDEKKALTRLRRTTIGNALVAARKGRGGGRYLTSLGRAVLRLLNQ